MVNQKSNYNLIIKTFNINDLKSCIQYLIKNLKQIQIIRLPVKTQKLTVLKSPHVNKQAREQFELKIYSNLLTNIDNNKKIIFKIKNILKKFKNINIFFKFKKIEYI